MNAPQSLSADNISARHAAPRIVLGITGGVAAYKCAELARLFVKAGVEVTTVMTEAATQFITPVTMQALTGRKVYTNLWDAEVPNNMAHIELTRHADLVLIAPATGDFMAKLAHGHADDLLSTLCLARNIAACPLFVAPAMNREMWDHPATARNVAQIRSDGAIIVGPAPGDQACGEVGMGRMLEPEDIFAAVMAHVSASPRSMPEAPLSTGTFKVLPETPHLARRFRHPLTGKTLRAVVTAGPTVEAIDPVRSITNASSGKMGYAIAEALRDAGIEVTLVSGPTNLSQPRGVAFVSIRSASELLAAVEADIADVDLFFAVAAVADYTPAAPKTEKMKKSTEALTIELVPTVDVLAKIAARTPAPFCVGFAAESHNVVEYATKKRQKKKIPMIVANHAGSAIGADDNSVTIIDDTGETTIARAPKAEIAAQIVSHALAGFDASLAATKENAKLHVVRGV
jgi:phosphopantothenoylcysteine decarboxylase / phosphopantothenate---cysteine ligase